MSPAAICVLLVEADLPYADVVTAALAAATPAAEVRQCGSLHEAARLLEERRFDGVLLDLDLPDSRGLDAIDRIADRAPGMPIVALTPSRDPEAELLAVRRGAQDYLSRSGTDPHLIARALRYAIERAAVQAELARRERVIAEEALRTLEARLRQVHKMEAVGRLAGGIAHDFNNVLTAIYGYADLLIDTFPRDDLRRADVEEIRRSAERAAALTRQLLAFSRQQVLQPQVLDLNQTVEQVHRMLTRLVGPHVVTTFEPAPDLWPVHTDRGQIEQVLLNLAANARDAMPEGGSIIIRTGNRTISAEAAEKLPGLRPGSYVCLSVTDSGTGMPESVRRRVFEPFFTTKAQGQGTGLGLATVFGTVKQSGGEIYVESEEHAGTTFTIYLPPHLPTSAP